METHHRYCIHISSALCLIAISSQFRKDFYATSSLRQVQNAQTGFGAYTAFCLLANGKGKDGRLTCHWRHIGGRRGMAPLNVTLLLGGSGGQRNAAGDSPPLHSFKETE